MALTGTKNNTDGKYVLGIDFLKKAVGDCVSDSAMDEITRRLVVFLRDNSPDIVRSESQPQDKTKLWYKPSTEQLYAYNPESGTWEITNVDNFSVCISAASSDALTKDAEGCLLLDAAILAGFSEQYNGAVATDGSGNATKTINLSNFEDENASVEVSFQSDPGATGRWWVSSQTASSVTVSFAGLTVSTSYNMRIVVRKS